jgi:serine/threonine protein kinase
MNVIFTRTNDSAPQLELVWQRRIDALICGECSEDDFLRELSRFRQAGGDSAWSVVALLDQRFRRGQVPVDLFRSIESKIAQRELGTPDYSITVDLLPALATPVLNPRPAAPGSFAARTDRTRAAEADRVLRNRYVLESRLGSGGMGTVFKALDRFRCDLPPANRHVAIKFLHEKTDGRPKNPSDLRREFYCAQALSHPNIVKVYELDRDDGIEFFTMEFIEGKLLSEVIEAANPQSLPRSRAWEIISEIAAGVAHAHAHAHNVIHADLKPQNIMITSAGQVRILDFGASSRNSSAVTPAYASCELLDGQPADARDDLFALACVAYELLAGEHPFQRRQSTEARHIGLVARRPRGLTRRQWRTLALGLAWRREDRSISVRDWIARLHPGMAAAQTPSTRMVALLATLFVGCVLFVASNRQLFESKIVAAPPLKTAANPPIAPESAAPVPVPEAVPASQPPPAVPSAPRNFKAAAPAQTDTLSLSARSYRVGSRNFAEIHVRRSGGSDGDTNFTWWTEPSSAIPGTDYIPQARTVQLMSKQRQTASLFVKLVPNAARKHSAVFYVVIGEPGNGTSLGRVVRTAVFLPPK